MLGSFPDNMEQLHPCQQLKELVVCDEQGQITGLLHMDPVPHHTTAELVAAFPNLGSLGFVHAVMPFVMQAFSQQVNILKLQVRNEGVYKFLKPYSKLHTLTFLAHPSVSSLLPLPAVTENLATLKLYMNDSLFEQLLQLPSLEYLTLEDLSYLESDFSDHAFKRQINLEMHGRFQHLHYFAKLPIKSIKQCVFTSPELELHLPDPENPDSMAIASKIARNNSDTNVRICSEHNIKWVVPRTADDARAAKVFAVVSSVIPPTESFELSAFTSSPALQKAVIQWAAPKADRIWLPVEPQALKPDFWHLLQQCSHLSGIGLIAEADAELTVGKEKLLAQVCDVICCAAEHLIVPALKPGGRMEFLILGTTPSFDDKEAHAHMVTETLKDSLLETLRVDCICIDVGDSGWELTLEKLDATPNVYDQPDATSI